MRRFGSARPSPAMVVAFIALLVALSGTATALQGKNTVDSGDIKNGVVKPADIKDGGVASKDVKNAGVTTDDLKNNDVRGGDVRDETLTGSDIDESTLGQVLSANSAHSANTANSANSANSANRATSAGSVDSLQVYSKTATPTVGANFEAAQAAAPPITLAQRGAFTIYGKCFKDTSAGLVWSFTYIRTSVDGAVLGSSEEILDGPSGFLNVDTPEQERAIRVSGVGPNDAVFSGDEPWEAMAPGGSAVGGNAGGGSKQGDLPGGNGIWGAGDRCLFSGFLAG